MFEICSGKGGDFFKWTRYKLSHYVALEYQESSIDAAIKRRNDSAKDIKFPSIFLVADAGDERNTIDRILERKEHFGNIKHQIEFDIVSCQFAMHYMFENESKLRAFLHNVSCRLAPGGFFIGTTIDSDQLLTRMRSKGTQGSVTTTLGN